MVIEQNDIQPLIEKMKADPDFQLAVLADLAFKISELYRVIVWESGNYRGKVLESGFGALD